MKNSIPLFIILILSLSFITNCAQEKHIVGKDMKETINLIESSYVEDGTLVGLVIGIVDQGEVKTYTFGSKEAEKKDQPDENSIFEIGSISKTFTGTLLAIQAQEQSIELDQPIDDFLPEEVSTPQFEGKKISLLDLATQSSSLPRMPRNFNRHVKTSKDPYINYPVSALYEYLNEVELDKTIGETYEYSNLGFGLLGHIVGRMDSSDYENAVSNNIFQKLGMNQSTVRITEKEKTNLALPHSGDDPVSQWEFTDAFMGAGAIKSSLKDMMIYLQANMHPEHTTLKEAIELAQKPQRKAGYGQIGLGWHIANSSVSQEPLIWHNGGTGGYQSFMGFSRTKDFGVVILSNSSTRSQAATEMGFQLLKAIEQFQ